MIKKTAILCSIFLNIIYFLCSIEYQNQLHRIFQDTGNAKTPAIIAESLQAIFFTFPHIGN